MHARRRRRGHPHEPRALTDGGGLRVGDTTARLWRLYPQASRQTGGYSAFRGYWLVTRRACAEVGGAPYPGLLARARNGRVTALVVATSACE